MNFRYKASSLALAVAFSSFVTVSSASAMVEDNSRVVTDPFYMPKAGGMLSETDLFATQRESEFENTAGVKTNDVETTNTVLGETFHYGISDNFAVRFGLAYSFGADTDNTPVGGTVSTSSSDGLYDPVLGATFRVMDQDMQGMNFDVLTDLHINVEDSESSSTSATGVKYDGTVNNGGHAIDLGVRVGKKFDTMSFAGVAGINYYMDYEYSSANPASTWTAEGDAYNDWYVGLQTQFRFAPQVSMNADLLYTIAGDLSEETSVGGVVGQNEEYSGGNALTLGLQGNYHLVPDQFVLSLYYSYSMIDDTDYSTGSPTPVVKAATVTGDTLQQYGLKFSAAF